MGQRHLLVDGMEWLLYVSFATSWLLFFNISLTSFLPWSVTKVLGTPCLYTIYSKNSLATSITVSVLIGSAIKYLESTSINIKQYLYPFSEFPMGSIKSMCTVVQRSDGT